MTLTDRLNLALGDKFSPDLNYQIVRHADVARLTAAGWAEAGTIPDSTLDADGTMVVMSQPRPKPPAPPTPTPKTAKAKPKAKTPTPKKSTRSSTPKSKPKFW